MARLPRKPGARILEIGVGTGLSLPHYAPQVRVTGIDVSPEMLARAHQSYPRFKYPMVESLLEMDAQQLEFADCSFDAVVAMYVASVVPDPGRMLREMARVCRPGGTILVLNHFASDRGGMRWVENVFAPLSRRIGFRPDFRLEPFLETANLDLIEIQRVNFGGYWKLVVFRNPGSLNGHAPVGVATSDRAISPNGRVNGNVDPPARPS